MSQPQITYDWLIMILEAKIAGKEITVTDPAPPGPEPESEPTPEPGPPPPEPQPPPGVFEELQEKAEKWGQSIDADLPFGWKSVVILFGKGPEERIAHVSTEPADETSAMLQDVIRMLEGVTA